MPSRVVTNEHCCIGANANALAISAKLRSITELRVFTAENGYGDKLTELSAIDKDGKINRIRLAASGQREVVKGILADLLLQPNILACDLELRSLLAQCQKVIQLAEVEAKQMRGDARDHVKYNLVRTAADKFADGTDSGQRPCPGCGTDLSQSQNHSAGCTYTGG